MNNDSDASGSQRELPEGAPKTGASAASKPDQPEQSPVAPTLPLGEPAQRSQAASSLVAQGAVSSPAKRPTALAQTAEVQPAVRPAQPMPQQIAPAAWATEALRIDLAASIRQRRRSFLRRMAIFVLLPTLLTAAYVFLYASPRYVSEFQITYQSYDQPSSSSSSTLLAGVLGLSGLGAGGAPVDMSRVLQSYLESDSVLRTVDKQLNLRAHYSDPKNDWLDRLSPGASEEDFLQYFSRRVTVDDMMGGYLVIDVEAFDPKFASAVATAMMQAADDMVEKLTIRARAEEVRAADVELKETQERLIKATVAVTNFRNEHRDFNPSTMASQLDTVVGGLETQLSQARAGLIRDRSYLSENSQRIVLEKSTIAALERQIEAEKHRLATTDGTTRGAGSADGVEPHSVPYSKIIEAYTALELEQKFATDSYLSAKQAYDLARADANRKENYVESFVAPNLPQRSTSPDPWIYILSAFLISLILYAVGSLLVGSFREQAGL
jgi:capsular polysaccharide transport system permease protein